MKPRHYTLWLAPDLVAFTFQGTVEVLLDVSTATRTLVCHAHELHVASVVATPLGGGAPMTATTVVQDCAESVQTVSATFAQALRPGQLRVRYTFTGVLNDKMAGFYRSSYAGPDGSTRYMGVTQFESCDARRAFPCWDEPALKATFSVTLRVPVDRIALSNMPESGRKAVDGDTLVDVSFEKSPLMSTYLVAFAVAECDMIQDTTKEGVTVCVFTPPGMGEQGRFALGVAVEALSFFTTYFGMPYPLPKMDLLAVPDFSAGAMENFGLVTFRTVLVLFDEKTTGSEAKQRLAYVVCHELAHQWFGNLVTMEWWTDLWLNEGYATYAGWMAVHAQFPGWRVWDQFLANEQARGLELDSLRSSHPIEVEISDSSKVGEIFDAISYSKGASVILMLVKFLGEQDFQKGMRLYCQRHAWGNARTADLWAALGDASGKPVAAMMGCWTGQVGYPVVSASRQGDMLNLSQTRFLSTGAAVDDADDGASWLVPLRIVSSVSGQSGPAREAVLSERQGCVRVEADARWVKLNSEQSGFFRTAYDQGLWAPLALAAPSLPAADRAGLVADAFALAAAGHASTPAALVLLSRLGDAGEADYAVWSAAASGLAQLCSAMYEAPGGVAEALRHLARGLFSPLAVRCGWCLPEGDDAPQEGHLETLLRTLALGKAAQLGDGETLCEARARFARFADGDHAALPPDLRASVFRAVLAHGGRSEFQALMSVYQGAPEGAAGQELRVAALQALGASPDPTLVRQALDFNLHGGSVRSQDLMYVIASAASNPRGRRVAWAHLREEWAAVRARLEGGGFLLGRIVALSTAQLSSDADAADVEAFFKDQGVQSISRTVAQSVEKIAASAAWVRRDGETTRTWLAAHGFEA